MYLLSFATFVAAASAAAVQHRPISTFSRDIHNTSIPTVSNSTSSVPATSGQSTFWLDQIDRNGSARGYAPFNPKPSSYSVYRNVMSSTYKAANDGNGDQTAAIQAAINDDGNGGSRRNNGVTTQPAQVYIPSGNYTLGSTLDLLMNTIIMGDPNDPPILKASAGFTGDTFINGYDNSSGHPEDAFFTQLRNVILDTTAVSGSANLTALQWGVAQACALGNVEINMATESKSQVGINLDGGSTVAVTDVRISGGSVGIRNSNQQVAFKNIYFHDCITAYEPIGGFVSLLQNVTFDTCRFGIDMTKGSPADVVLLDAVSTNSGDAVLYHDSSNDAGSRNSQMVIENLKHDGTNPIAVTSTGKTTLKAQAAVNTWVWGNVIPGQYVTGNSYTTSRPSALLNSDGSFFTMDAPNYARYSIDQVVNVKNVLGHTVKGNGKVDDSASLNAILAQNARDCKVTFFPYGVYIVKDTLVIPPNSRIMGEAWSVISGAGDKFKDAANPVPVVQVGNAQVGTTGVASISDMRFTVSEVLPGAIIVEVNMAGAPGDVGLWNSAITIGGTNDSSVTTSCSAQDTTSCMAAFMGLHLSSSSSAYVQNLWVWTADHAIDGGPNQIISTGRGILVEATKGTWLAGTASEHNWLYNYNLNGAQNVFAGMQQTETPYMQGGNAVLQAPAPWTATAAYGDPDFSWCAAGDGKCRTSVAVNVQGGRGVYLYSAAAWAFFSGPWDGSYSHTVCQGSCQTNMHRVAGAPQNMVWFGVNTKQADVMILDGGANPKTFNNPGGWGGDIAAYMAFANATKGSVG